MAMLEARPYRPFKSSEEYLEAMKEDLAEWLSTLYPELRINAENFMDRLDTGVALCKVSTVSYLNTQLFNFIIILRRFINMLQNVSITSYTHYNPSRADLIGWVNILLKTDLKKIDELCTGAAYCQLFHMLCPKAINLKRVKFTTNMPYEFMQNFRLLQLGLVKRGINIHTPIHKIVEGSIQYNMEFLIWFKLLFSTNYDPNVPYDPEKQRGYSLIGRFVETKAQRLQREKTKTLMSLRDDKQKLTETLNNAINKVEEKPRWGMEIYSDQEDDKSSSCDSAKIVVVQKQKTDSHLTYKKKRPSVYISDSHNFDIELPEISEVSESAGSQLTYRKNCPSVYISDSHNLDKKLLEVTAVTEVIKNRGSKPSKIPILLRGKTCIGTMRCVTKAQKTKDTTIAQKLEAADMGEQSKKILAAAVPHIVLEALPATESQKALPAAETEKELSSSLLYDSLDSILDYVDKNISPLQSFNTLPAIEVTHDENTSIDEELDNLVKFALPDAPENPSTCKCTCTCKQNSTEMHANSSSNDPKELDTAQNISPLHIPPFKETRDASTSTEDPDKPVANASSDTLPDSSPGITQEPKELDTAQNISPLQIPPFKETHDASTSTEDPDEPVANASSDTLPDSSPVEPMEVDTDEDFLEPPMAQLPGRLTNNNYVSPYELWLLENQFRDLSLNPKNADNAQLEPTDSTNKVWSSSISTGNYNVGIFSKNEPSKILQNCLVSLDTNLNMEKNLIMQRNIGLPSYAGLGIEMFRKYIETCVQMSLGNSTDSTVSSSEFSLQLEQVRKIIDVNAQLQIESKLIDSTTVYKDIRAFYKKYNQAKQLCSILPNVSKQFLIFIFDFNEQ